MEPVGHLQSCWLANIWQPGIQAGAEKHVSTAGGRSRMNMNELLIQDI